jgi:hypothetical protein
MKPRFLIIDGGCALLIALSGNDPWTNPWATYVLSVVTNLQNNRAPEFQAWTDDGFVVALQGPADIVTGVQLSYERPDGPGTHTLHVGLGVIELNLFLGRWLTGLHLPCVPLSVLGPILGDIGAPLRRLKLPPLDGLFGSALPLPVALGVTASVADCEDEEAISSRIARWATWWKAGHSRTRPTRDNDPSWLQAL